MSAAYDVIQPTDRLGPPVQFAAYASVGQLRGCRCDVPRDGVLNELFVWVNTTGGNYCGLVYEGASVRTKLWQGAWAAVGAAGGWRSLGTPNLQLAQGAAIELALACDSTTPTFLRGQTWTPIASPPAPFIQLPPAVAWQNGPAGDNRVANPPTGGGDFLSWHTFGNGWANGSVLPASIALETLTWASPPVWLVGTYQ